MKLKKSLFCIITMGIFVSGCSMNNDISDNYLADSATKQKTMTKVQNNVNEILNKDYDYVIKNMGKPYSEFYYINLDDVEKSKTVEELIKKDTSRVLTYPKNTDDRDIDKSALYIEIEHNKVVDVETDEFLDGEGDVPIDDSYITIENYSEGAKLLIKDINGLDSKKYINKDVEHLNDAIGNKKCNFEIFDKHRKGKVVGYFLKEKNGSIKKALVIVEESKTVKSIKIIDKNSSINNILDCLAKN